MKYCDFNGCTNKIDRGKYCHEHKPKRRRKKKESIYKHENKPFYRTDAWKSMRKFVYERERGKCQRCRKFVFGRNAHVHHVVPIKEDYTLKLEPKNLRLLCRYCHMIEENEENKKKVFPSYFD